MTRTMQSLLAHPALSDHLLAAGSAGLGRPVSCVAPLSCRPLWEAAGRDVLVLLEPDPPANMGEPDWQAALAEGRVAAFIFKPAGPGAAPPELTWECARQDVPLLVLPAERLWLDVYPALLAELDETARAAPVREAFLRMALAGGGRHGTLELLRWLVENPVLSLGPDLAVVDHSGRHRYGIDLAECARAVARAAAATSPKDGGAEIAAAGAAGPDGAVMAQVVPIGAAGGLVGYVAVVAANRGLSPAAGAAADRAAEMMGWQHVHESRRRIEWQTRNHFLAELLIGRYAKVHSARAWASALGLSLAPRYVVVAVVIDDYATYFLGNARHGNGVSDTVKERVAAIVADAVHQNGADSFAVGFSDGVAAALGLPATASARAAQALGRSFGEQIRDAAGRAFSEMTVSVGIGHLVESVGDLPEGYAGARKTAALGRQLFGPGGVHGLDELGFFRLLDRVEDTEFMATFARDILGPLAEHDAFGQAPVLPTLEAYLAADGNRLRCAAQLFLHPNTVSYRLGLVEKLTGLSPLRSEDRFLLQTALKVRQHLTALKADQGAPQALVPGGVIATGTRSDQQHWPETHPRQRAKRHAGHFGNAQRGS